ncbi:MAG TPA: hypothetical protein PLZ86_07180 [bacterium]|nr:hypothetical protein [bacterium]
MKRTKAVVTCLAVAVVVFGAMSAVRAEVAGYVQDVEHHPELFEKPSCGQVYSSFLSSAQPLVACKHLAEAKAEKAAQEKLAQQLGQIKNCRKCQAQMGMAKEAAAAYVEQINIYSKQCPPEAEQLKLAASLEKEAKKVCKACGGKWPGNVGIDGKSPCK